MIRPKMNLPFKGRNVAAEEVPMKVVGQCR
jgi:hypothetical protein